MHKGEKDLWEKNGIENLGGKRSVKRSTENRLGREDRKKKLAVTVDIISVFIECHSSVEGDCRGNFCTVV